MKYFIKLGCVNFINMLISIILIPIIGVFLILLVKNYVNNSDIIVKNIALGSSLVTFIVSIIMWAEFDSSEANYQFIYEFDSYVKFGIGIDSISLYYVLLTTFVTPLCLLSNYDNINFKVEYYVIAFLLMESILIAYFVSLDLIMFYIFYEAVLIPMFFVIGIWGGSVNRVRAAFLLFLYTILGSLFMLLGIMIIWTNIGTTDFTILDYTDLSLENTKYIWLAFFFAFCIKAPVCGVHIWLPRAHSEAPAGGSMLLASLLLKLATYGYLRILVQIMPDATAYFTPLAQIIGIITLIYSSIATIRCVDTKALVAYSSISHMAIVILGIFSNSFVGIQGAILLSIAHGFISPAMFALVGAVLYDQTHTRAIRYYRGLVLYMPVFALLFFITTLANIGVPLSLNWTGEIMSLAGIFQQSPIIGVLASSSIVLSACYSIFLFNRITFGSYSLYLPKINDVNRREFILLIPILIVTVALGIMPNVILNDLNVVVSTLLF